MSDKVAVDVVTRYWLDTNLDAQMQKVRGIGQSMTNAIRDVEGKVATLEGTLSKVGGAFAAYFGVHQILEAKKAIFESLGMFEQMQLGIGGTLAATGAAKFTDSIDIAKHRLKELY